MTRRKVQVIGVSYVDITLDSGELKVGDVLTSNDGWFRIDEPVEAQKEFYVTHPLRFGIGWVYYCPDGVASITVGSVWEVNSVEK